MAKRCEKKYKLINFQPCYLQLEILIVLPLTSCLSLSESVLFSLVCGFRNEAHFILPPKDKIQKNIKDWHLLN